MLYELIFLACLKAEPDKCGHGHWDEYFTSIVACEDRKEDPNLRQFIANDVVRHFYPETRTPLEVGIKFKCVLAVEDEA